MDTVMKRPESISIISAQQEIQNVINAFPELSAGVWYLIFSDFFSKSSLDFQNKLNTDREEFFNIQQSSARKEMINDEKIEEEIIEEVV